jgi:hypothetical protein
MRNVVEIAGRDMRRLFGADSLRSDNRFFFGAFN